MEVDSRPLHREMPIPPYKAFIRLCKKITRSGWGLESSQFSLLPTTKLRWPTRFLLESANHLLSLFFLPVTGFSIAFLAQTSRCRVRPAWLASVSPHCEKIAIFLMLLPPHLVKKGWRWWVGWRDKSKSVQNSSKDDEKNMTKPGRHTSYGDGQNTFFFLTARLSNDFFPSHGNVSHTLANTCTKLGTMGSSCSCQLSLKTLCVSPKPSPSRVSRSSPHTESCVLHHHTSHWPHICFQYRF